MGDNVRAHAALTALRKIMRVTDGFSRELSAKTGLTASQLLLLQILGNRGEATAGEIAHRIGITQATTTSLIRKLEERGLIHRQRGEADKRQVWLRMTPQGEQALASAPDGLQERFVREFSYLADWEKSMLTAALERISSMLDADDIDAAPVLDVGAIDRGT